jgi:predicted DCC family thiol-disulfide oxidoreductase YuxK
MPSLTFPFATPHPDMNAPVILYDGNCGFCDRTVKFVLRRDPHGPLRFAALQSEFGQALVARHPALAGVDSVVWAERVNGAEQVRIRTDAALRLGTYLGGPWRVLAMLGRIVPRALRDAAYDAFARRRYRWFGTADACELPGVEERKRFIG